MANTIELPNLKFFQWQRPNAANPRLSVPLNLNDDEVEVSSPPLDENGDVITGDFIFGVRNSAGYVENIYVPPGEVSADGLTFTNVVRGINTTGLDYNTTVPELVAEHGQDSPVFCNVTGVYESILAACLRGQSVRTNGVNFIQGTGSAETVTVSRDDGTVRGWLRFDDGTQNVQFSNDGSAWVNLSPGGANSLIAITAADTSPGYLDDKLDVTSNNPVLSVQKNVLNPGGGEILELEYDVDSTDTSSGAGDAGKLVELDAGGKIDSSMVEIMPSSSQLKIYGLNSYGDDTSRYDITNPSGDTFRYTYDSTGTNPHIGTHSMIAGQTIDIVSSVFNAANTGTFTITNVGANFFEIENPSGVAENDVTRGTGRIGSPDEYTPSSNAVKIKVEIWAGGGSGGYRVSGGGYGAGGGAYRRRNYFPFDLSIPVSFTVGNGGASKSSTSSNGDNGGNTIFNTDLIAYGGGGGNSSNSTIGSGAGGGGALSQGFQDTTNNSFVAWGGLPGNPVAGYSSTEGGGSGGGENVLAGVSVEGGGGGGGSGTVTGVRNGGNSLYGGAGGGSRSGGNGLGGTSVYGGNGGNATTDSQAGNGQIKGGGGGGSQGGSGISGRGGAGLVQITEYLK
jgi:hypothetical protein